MGRKAKKREKIERRTWTRRRRLVNCLSGATTGAQAAYRQLCDESVARRTAEERPLKDRGKPRKK